MNSDELEQDGSANCPPPPDAASSLASAAPPAAPAPPAAAGAAPGAANQDTSGSTYLQSKAKTDLKSGPLAEGEGMKEAQDFGDGQSNYTNMAMPSATKSEIATGESKIFLNGSLSWRWVLLTLTMAAIIATTSL